MIAGMLLRNPNFIKTHELAHKTVTNIACKMAVIRDGLVGILIIKRMEVNKTPLR